MAMEDEELLQDFIVEAGEILEQLNEQLVELENRPQDNDLLNAVFRGFHTIKGGGSFLGLDAMVDVCHRSEDVFNLLRNGERNVDTELMDIILPVLDVLNDQFEAIRAGNDPEPADNSLLAQLDSLRLAPEPAAPQKKEKKKKKESPKPEATAPVKSGVTQSDSPEPDEITDEEFEALLDTLDTTKESSDKKELVETTKENATQHSESDDITDDEFESLLDDLNSQKKESVKDDSPAKVDNKVETSAKDKSDEAESEEIDEAEFDQILDKLHGKVEGSKSTTSKVDAAANVKSSISTQKQTASRPPATKARDAAPQAESTVRVDTKRLDDIMNMVGELVLVRNRMATLEAAINDEEISKVVANLDVVTADLQTSVMKTRMQPIKKVFGRFPRVVRDLARNLNKEVNLELQGEDTDLDKNLVEALADPLVHLVRNAVDHGIETPDEREAKSKSRTGTVILTAEQEGDHILLTIEDDGKGMDADQLRKAAVKKGLMDEESAARLDPKECYNLIFAPGFSTKTEISDVSGRGVGMDVVKTRIVQLNGSVEIDSKLDRGSVIIIKVPLTLAIMPTLMVMLEKQIFALPLASVNEIFHLDLTHTNIVDGQLVVMVRDKALPLYYLRHWLVKGHQDDALPDSGHVVVVSMGAQKIGFVVDSLIGQEEVVIKPLGALLHGMRGLAGATITGDGRISLILDIPGLMHNYARRM